MSSDRLDRHTSVLVRKNALLKWRSPCSTLFELLLAPFCMFMLVAARWLSSDTLSEEIAGGLVNHHIDKTLPVRLPECAEFLEAPCDVTLLDLNDKSVPDDQSDQFLEPGHWERSHALCVAGATFGCSSPQVRGGPVGVWVSGGCGGHFRLPNGRAISCRGHHRGIAMLRKRSCFAKGENGRRQVLVVVGGSEYESHKCVTATEPVWCPQVVNYENIVDVDSHPTALDTFGVEVTGTKVCVQRLDQDGMWRLNLTLRCVAADAKADRSGESSLHSMLSDLGGGLASFQQMLGGTTEGMRLYAAGFAVAPPESGRAFKEWLEKRHHPWASHVRIFESGEAVHALVTSSQYPKRDDVTNMSSLLCGAVIFDTKLSADEVRYTLRFNTTVFANQGLPRIARLLKAMGSLSTASLVDVPVPNRDGGTANIVGNTWYTQTGFLAMQRSIDEFVADVANASLHADRLAADVIARHPQSDLEGSGMAHSGEFGRDFASVVLDIAQSRVSAAQENEAATLRDSFVGEDGRPHVIVPFPTRSSTPDIFLMFLPALLGHFLLVSVTYSMTRMITLVVAEREKRLRDGMRLMGMHPISYHFSWVITYFVITLVASVSVSLCLCYGNILPNTDKGLLFLWLQLFASASLAYGLAISTLFSKAKTAATVGSVVFYGSSYLHLLVQNGTSNRVRRFVCLLPPACFKIGAQIFATLESQGRGVSLSTIADPCQSYGSVLECLVFLFVDAIWLSLLFLYLDQVMPREIGLQRPWYFLCHPSTWRRWSGSVRELPLEPAKIHTIQPGPEEKSALIEPDLAEAYSAMARSGNTVELREVTRIYADGKLAVDRLNLIMYAGEVFALLGHNGAGKTTTLAMLCGLISPTSGHCILFGYDLSVNPSEAQKLLGVCPQHDVLWDELTCREHLRLFGDFKGISPEYLEAEITNTLLGIGLLMVENRKSMHLSGGMKRRLSLGIAFIGGSRVVVLDEPTSGLDPFARRGVWELLRGSKQGRVIVLSTHYMDEADILGDRIAILREGRLQCCGSAQFLKRAYGCGYNLTFVKRGTSLNSDALQDAVGRHVPELSSEVKVLSDSAKELVLQVPFAAVRHFSAILGGVELHREELGIESYGISFTPLEEVFLKVASGEALGQPGASNNSGALCVEDDSAYAPMQDIDIEMTELGEHELCVPVSSQKDRISGLAEGPQPAHEAGAFRTFVSRTCVLVLKRTRYGRRDKKSFLCQLMLPPATLLLCLGLMSVELFRGSPALVLDPREYNNDCRASPQNLVDFSHLPSVNLEDAKAIMAAGSKQWNGVTRFFAPEEESRYDAYADKVLTEVFPEIVKGSKDSQRRVEDAEKIKVAGTDSMLSQMLSHVNLLQTSQDLRGLTHTVKLDPFKLIEDSLPDNPEDPSYSTGNKLDALLNQILPQAISALKHSDTLDRGKLDQSLSMLPPLVVQASDPNQAGNRARGEVDAKQLLNEMLSRATSKTRVSTSGAVLPGAEAAIRSVANRMLSKQGGLQGRRLQRHADLERLIAGRLSELLAEVWSVDVIANYSYERVGVTSARPALIMRQLQPASGVQEPTGRPEQFVDFTRNVMSYKCASVPPVITDAFDTSGGDLDLGTFVEVGSSWLESSQASAALNHLEAQEKRLVENGVLQAIFLLLDADHDGLVNKGEVCQFAYDLRRVWSHYWRAAETFSQRLIEASSECSRFGAFLITHADGRYGADAAIFVNTTSSHAAPAFQSAFTNARFALSGMQKRVLVTVHPFPQTRDEQQTLEQVAVFNLAVYITFCLSFIPAGIASYIVRERSIGSRQLQALSGASTLSYWLANLIYDCALYVVTAVCIAILLWAFGFTVMVQGQSGQALSCVLAAFGPAMIGFTYLICFLFRDHSTASNTVLACSLFGAGILSAVLFILVAINYDPQAKFPMACETPTEASPDGTCRSLRVRLAERIVGPIFRLVPTVSCYQALFAIALCGDLHEWIPKEAMDALSGSGDWENELGIHLSFSVWAYEWVGEPLRYLVFEGMVYFLLVIALDITMHSPWVARQLDAGVCVHRVSRKCRWRGVGRVNMDGNTDALVDPEFGADQDGGDEGVAFEHERLKFLSPEDAALHVLHLQKTYRSWLCPRRSVKKAVRGLSFAVHPGEVFGLLGHNGAGKTSALKCIVGELCITAGNVCVGGFDIEKGAAQAQKHLGYCPQFDALLELLTVRDHLDLFVGLRCLPSDSVEQALQNFGLSALASRRADVLSGGNRRRLSAAIALLGSPRLVVLDEPSCGLDPGARRALWVAVQTVVGNGCCSLVVGNQRSQATAVLLTTHSMEEAEALSNRLGVMVDGRLTAVGTAQQIKQKHSGTHELTVTLEGHSVDTLEAVVRELGFEGDTLLTEGASLGHDAVRRILESHPAKDRAYRRPRCSVRSQVETTGEVSMVVLAEWFLQQSRGEAVESMLRSTLGDGVELVENFGSLFRYRLPRGVATLPEIFAHLESSQASLHVAEYALTQATLEQIFNSMAGEASVSGEE